MEFSLSYHSMILGHSEAPKAVLLHGWGRDSESMMALAELLADDYCVHALDLPGFGKTPLPPEVWGAHEYARSVKEYLQQHQLNEVMLVGHSLGGRVAIALASEYPEYVKRLVLINSAGIPRRLSLRQKARRWGIRQASRVIKYTDAIFKTRLYEERFIPRFASLDYRNAQERRAILVKMVNQDLTAELKRIQQPALLLWGALDTETPLEVGQRMAGYLSHATLKVLQQHGHDPLSDAGSHLLAYLIRRWSV